MKETHKKIGLYVLLTEEEYSKIREMKEHFAINMSQLVKNYIFSLYEKLQKDNYQTLDQNNERNQKT
jgi:hypothetical protein